MKKLVFCLSLCGFILAGCNKNEPVNEPEGDRDLTVFFSSESILTTQIKSVATSDEGKIDRVVIFGFDASNNFVTGNKWNIANPALTGLKLTAVSKYVTQLYAIANPTTVIQNLTVSNVTGLLNQTNDYPANGRPTSPFLMSGKGAVTNYTATIKLYFVVAKVQINPVNFTITSVAVNNSPNRVYVSDENIFNNTTPLPPPSIPSGFSRVNYSSPSPLPNPLVLYVPENDATTTGNSTKFVVNGTVNGTAITPYTFELKLNNNIIPIRRNTHYTVSLTAIIESEGTITITIPTWTDQPIQNEQF